MTQDEKWMARYNEVVTFIESNKRNPSKYDAEERGEYYTWLKHNRKQMNAGTLKPERLEKFKSSINVRTSMNRGYSPCGEPLGTVAIDKEESL